MLICVVLPFVLKILLQLLDLALQLRDLLVLQLQILDLAQAGDQELFGGLELQDQTPPENRNGEKSVIVHFHFFFFNILFSFLFFLLNDELYSLVNGRRRARVYNELRAEWIG